MQYSLTSFGKSWHAEGPKKDQPEGIEIEFSSSYTVSLAYPAPTNRQAIESFQDFLKRDEGRWLHPGPKEWLLDLDRLRKTFPEFSTLTWLRGKISIEPRAETYESPDSLENRAFEERSGFPTDPYI